MLKESLLTGYGLTQFTLTINMEGFTQEESRRLPEGGGNSILWVLGHILYCRDMILGELGEKAFLSEGETKPFVRGAPLLEAKDEAISMDRLMDGLKRTSESLLEKLGPLDDESLGRALNPDQFPVPVKEFTLGVWLTVFLFHESYHAGQVGTLRRAMGKEGVIA
jgi:uncharacterized damage-inducible protein DinB